MYTRKAVSNSVMYVNPNLKKFLHDRRTVQSSNMFKYLWTFRSISLSEVNTYLNTRVSLIDQAVNVLANLKQKLCKMPCKLKTDSEKTMQVWLHQCECVVAQRLRRSQQMFCMYSKLWDEKAIQELIKLLRQQISRRSKNVIFSAMGLSVYNWDTQRITDDELMKYIEEFNYVRDLEEKTIVCEICHKRRLVDVALPNVSYCNCSNNVKGKVFSHDSWVPFLERTDLIVWRRQHDSANYEYKVYGRYDDVTAEDFLQVQIDSKYRRTWDTTAINLEVIESDEQSNSDILYWEMQWPRLFTNRDYVFNRRYAVDKENKTILIMSRTTEHPSCPVKPNKYRVSDYWSCMVIRATSELDRPGIEFSLTYFDDPGVNIPSAVASWVATSGMPDFLLKLRKAAKDYAGLRPTLGPVMASGHAQVTTLESDNAYWPHLHPHFYLG